MHLRRISLIAFAAGICLAPLATPPALAAAPASTAVTASDTAFDPVIESVVVVDGVGSLNRQIRIAVEGLDSRTSAIVYSGAEPVGDEIPKQSSSPDGKIILYRDVESGHLNELTVLVASGNHPDEIRLPVTVDDTPYALAAPKVSVAAHPAQGRADVTVTGPVGSIVYLRDSRGWAIQSAVLSDPTETLSVPLTDSDAKYTVHLRKPFFESEGTPITLPARDAVSAPAAPEVRVKMTTDARAVLEVTSTPGSVIRVAAPDGRLLAVKVIGASGAVQALTPLADEAMTATVTTAVDSQVSLPISVELPSAS